MKKHQYLIGAFVLFAAIVGFAAQAQAETIFGLTAASSQGTAPGVGLVFFDSATPGTVTSVGTFSTGLVAGQSIRSIDFRTSTGVLYAIGTSPAGAPMTGTLYTVDLGSAVLTPVNAVPFTLGTNTDVRVELEWNPTTDNFTVLTAEPGTGKTNNFTLTPAGVLTTNTNLAFDASDPNNGITNYTIIAAAYSNNVAGASTTSLYAWDWLRDDLVRIGGLNSAPPPVTSGLMFTVNFPPGFVTTNSGVGMDISPNSGICYATHDDGASGTTMQLYTRSLVPGAAVVQTLVGAYPAGTFIVDISVRRTPTAAGVSVSGRVMSPDGRGLTNAIVTMTGNDGVSHMAITQRFGNYRFDNVESGQTYIMRVRSKRFRFSSQVVQVFDNLTGVDFTAEGGTSFRGNLAQ